jgi:hypothetical protein
MKSKLALFVLVLGISVSSVSAQINDTYVIPVIANNAGGAGTVWTTELTLFNPQPHDLVVSLVFMPEGSLVGKEVLVDVFSNETLIIANVVAQGFGMVGVKGALVAATFPEDNPGIPDRMISRAFLVNSNTFNNAPSGTYGQSVPGVWQGLFDYDFDEITAVAPGVKNIGVAGSSGHRTNVGAANLGRDAVTLYTIVYDAAGNRRGEFPLIIPPLGYIQDALPVALQGGSLEFWVHDPGPYNDAIVFPYATVVDNRSGDGVYVNPTLLASAATLFQKGEAVAADPGKRIDTSVARRVRDAADRVGKLERTPDGLQLAAE